MIVTKAVAVVVGIVIVVVVAVVSYCSRLLVEALHYILKELLVLFGWPRSMLHDLSVAVIGERHEEVRGPVAWVLEHERARAFLRHGLHHGPGEEVVSILEFNARLP